MNRNLPDQKNAAAVILIKSASAEILRQEKNPQRAFLQGYLALAGGALKASDALIKIENCADEKLAEFIACAARQAFEKIGVLLVRNGDKLTKGQRASLRDDLLSGRMTFAEILEHWNLRIDARDFFHTGFLTISQPSPASFNTGFFLAVCPLKQESSAAVIEPHSTDVFNPQDVLPNWEKQTL